jgi:hypothetical protein
LSSPIGGLSLLLSLAIQRKNDKYSYKQKAETQLTKLLVTILLAIFLKKSLSRKNALPAHFIS